MPTKNLPQYPSLVHFKHQAKDLLSAFREGDTNAKAKVAEFHPRFSAKGDAGKFALSDAQLVVAREYSFASWMRLRECVATMDAFTCSPHKEESPAKNPAEEFLRLICLTYGVDAPSRREKAHTHLAQHREIKGTNIHVAAAMGDAAAIGRFIAGKRQVASERGGPHRWEPLLYLAYSRYQGAEAEFVESVRLLLQAGADPNAAYVWDGALCLFTALTGCFGEGEAGPVNQPPHRDCEGLARLLLESGADSNDSQTLYNRQFTQSTSHLELLFEYGLGKPSKNSWVERMGGKLMSPDELLVQQLRWAVSEGHLDRVKLLTAHSVELNGASRDGKTPYEIAVLRGYQEIAEFLLQNGAEKKELSVGERFLAACVSADRETAASLIESNPGILGKLEDKRHRTFVFAAGANRLEAVRLMVELGFNPSELGRNTALHAAAWNGHLEMVKLLVELGADTSIRDRAHNARPVDWAKHNLQQAVVEYLESLG